MKVLIADKFPDKYMAQLKELGHEVIFEPKLGENDLPANINDADVLVVRSTVVNAATSEAATKLKLIIRAGAGVNNIDIPAANGKGISVANCPGKNSIAVAELAVGLMLSLDRMIPDNVSDFRNGVWNKAEYSKADGLYGKTLAIVGYGHIGQEVAKRAKAFGIKIYAKDIFEIKEEGVTQFEDFAEVLPKADIISLHLPVNAHTKGMFNAEMFGMMKEGATLINTSRAGVIDEAALIEAVKTKGLKVGLDVFNDEPEGKSGDVSSPLKGIPGVYVTHHIGASTAQAQDAVAEEVIKIVDELAKTGNVLNEVKAK